MVDSEEKHVLWRQSDSRLHPPHQQQHIQQHSHAEQLILNYFSTHWPSFLTVWRYFMKTSLFWRQHWLNSVLNFALTNVLHDFSAVFILCVVFKFDDKMRMTVCVSCFAANWDKAKVHRLHIFRQISLTFYFTARCFNSTFTCFSAAGSGTVQDGVIRGRSYHV